MCGAKVLGDDKYQSLSLSVLMTLTDRIRSRVTPGEGGCLIVEGGLVNGYAKVARRVGGRDGEYTNYYAHRIIWQATNGPVPEGMMLMHSCDVRNCVNLDHLSLGTAWDNNHDMLDKGRGRRPVTKDFCIHGHDMRVLGRYRVKRKEGYGFICHQCKKDREAGRESRG